MSPADVVVVGARCAGAATALLLARMGHRVTLVDRAELPSDTLSTHALSRGGVVQLARWGLLEAVLGAGAPAIRRVRFFVEGEVTHRVIKPRSGVDFLLAPRRIVLDQILVDAAVDAGVELHTGLGVTGLTRDDGRVSGVTARDRTGRPRSFAARVVVGADGVRSRIARAVGAPLIDERTALGAAHYAYFRGDPWDGFEFHIADGIMAGVFPTNGGEANVWACTPAADTRHGLRDRADGLLGLLRDANPDLADRMLAAERTSPVRGAIGLPNHIRRAWGPGWALVGDAGMHRDPITGHGITDAFRDAELLARALHGVFTGDLAEPEADRLFHDLRHELTHELFDATVAMTGFPPVEEFVAQQLRSTAAMEAEARFLVDLSPLPAVMVTAA